MSHSDKYCLNMEITHGQPWSELVQRRIVPTIVSMFKSIPLGSPIPLVYNLLDNGFPCVHQFLWRSEERRVGK